MFVGQDRAGKTSLKKSLQGLPFDPAQCSTDGIDVDCLEFEYEGDQVKNWRVTDETFGISQHLKVLAKKAARQLKKEEEEETKRLLDVPKDEVCRTKCVHISGYKGKFITPRYLTHEERLGLMTHPWIFATFKLFNMLIKIKILKNLTFHRQDSL